MIEEPLFTELEHVEKYEGDALWNGIVVAVYYTTRGKLRYVVEVLPQGFQMIATQKQLRKFNVLTTDNG